MEIVAGIIMVVVFLGISSMLTKMAIGILKEVGEIVDFSLKKLFNKD